MTIYVWLYRSRATRHLKSPEILELLNRARLNNGDLNLTGMLLFHNGCFTQVLEGDRATVTRMKDKISSDGLHGDIVTLYEGEWESRVFSSWSMAFRKPTEIEREKLEHYLPLDWAARTLTSVDIRGQLNDAFHVMADWAMQA